MNIVVCIKQVPDTANVRINEKTGTMEREGVPAMVNPYDLYAVEEALKVKEEHGGTVTALSMGPPQVEEALREVIAMGVDQGCLLTDRAFAGADTLATSYTLAQGLGKIGEYDLIFCGKQAVDGDTAQVGPELAEHLGLPRGRVSLWRGEKSRRKVFRFEGWDEGELRRRLVEAGKKP